MSKPCGAKTSAGTPCKHSGTGTGDRCRLHGGESHPGGPGHPNFKHGLFAKGIPPRLRARYEEQLADPELVEHRRASALLGTRAEELLAKLDTGESGTAWRRARELYDAARQHLAANEADAAMLALTDLGIVLREGAAEWRQWDELVRLLDRRKGHVLAEQKRLAEMKQHVTTEEMLVLLYRLADRVKQLVPDPEVHRQLALELRTLGQLEREN